MGNHRASIVLAMGLAASGCASVESNDPDAASSTVDAPAQAVDAPAQPVDAAIDAPDPVQLQIDVTGPGQVLVAPAGTSCGAGCTMHERGTNVTLTAQPDQDAVLLSWSGVCASTAPGAPCAFALTAETTIEVVFRPPFVTSTFEVTGAPQTYTVPAGATRLSIVADGASGGDAMRSSGGAYVGGRGAHVETVVDVSGGQMLTIIVGAMPAPNPAGSDGCGAGGGGASMVALGTTVLAVAGGGGGASAYGSYANNGGDAQVVADGASSGSVAGGTGGNGGGSVAHEGGGGAGVLGDGIAGVAMGGQALLDGAAGGLRDQTEQCGTINGGFGGGGGGGNDFGGGGGGYSGGAAHGVDNAGLTSGGGGSYAMGTPTISVRGAAGNGRVVLTPQ